MQRRDHSTSIRDQLKGPVECRCIDDRGRLATTGVIVQRRGLVGHGPSMHCTTGDPLTNKIDLFRGQRLALGRHPIIVIGRQDDAFVEFTVVRLPRLDGPCRLITGGNAVANGINCRSPRC